MKQFSVIFLLVIVVFVLAALFVIFSPPRDPTLKDILKYNPPALTPSETVPQQDITQKTVTRRTDSVNADTTQTNYYIIVASIKNLSMAEQKAERLKKEFNANFIVLPPSEAGNYRISYGKYSTLEEVKSTIINVRTKIRPDVWILSEKK